MVICNRDKSVSNGVKGPGACTLPACVCVGGGEKSAWALSSFSEPCTASIMSDWSRKGLQ